MLKNILAVLLIASFLRYSNIIFQEGNPLPLVKSIVQIETTNARSVQYSKAPDKYLSEVKPGTDRYQVVQDFMQNKGWTFKEQLGAGLVFTKGYQEVVVETRQYTRKYLIWSVPETSGFQDL